MCMLFVCANKAVESDDFSLIVTSIRDEYYMRPTKTCQFWESNPNVIGGMDLEVGREGGTWLAMSKSGKIGALLNMLQPLDQVVPGKKHRGFLVPDYLESRLSGPSFLGSLSRESKDYADFLMVTIDVKTSLRASNITSFFTNMGQCEKPIVLNESGIYSFGNNLPQKPWIKTIVGRKIFENITLRNRSVRKKKNLVHELFGMMSDETEYFPDEQLLYDGRGYDDEYLRGLSSLNVKLRDVGFGSRTQTVILVDRRGNVDFIERTMDESALRSSAVDDFKWPMKKFRFRIDRERETVPVYSSRL